MYELRGTGIIFLDHQIGMTTNAVEKMEAEAWMTDVMSMTCIEMDDEQTTPMWVGWKSNLIARDDKT